MIFSNLILDFEPAFWYVFQDTLVMENLASARRLMGKARMVTLEGELLEKSGAMVGGFPFFKIWNYF